MTAILWWVVAVCLVMGAALLIVNALPHAQEKALLRFQNNVGVDLPQRLAERLRRRMLINRRSSLIGGMAGILVSALIVDSRAPSSPNTLDTFILIAGAFAGPTLAISIAALLTASKDSDDHVRYARSHAVGLSDYVPPLERWVARGLTLLAIAFLAAWSISSWLRPAASDTQAFINGALFTLIAAGTLLICEIAGRRIVAMGIRAGSPEKLVWEDAIRSLTVRDLAGAPALVGLYAIMWTAPALLSEGAGAAVVNSTGLMVSFGVIVVAIISMVFKPERHFLRRLWPELAAEADKPRPAEATP